MSEVISMSAFIGLYNDKPICELCTLRNFDIGEKVQYASSSEYIEKHNNKTKYKCCNCGKYFDLTDI